MKYAVSPLLSTVLLCAHASAQTTPPASQIIDTRVNPMTQSGDVSFVSDYGFPTGQLAVQANLDCMKGTSLVEAYKSDNLGSFGPNPDPASLPTVTAANVVQASPTAIQVPTVAGKLRMFCKDKVLYTDFSGAFGKGAVKGQDQLGSSMIHVRQSQMKSTIDFEVPLSSQKRNTDDIVDTITMNVELNARSLSTPKSIYNLSIGYLNSDPAVAVFLYDAKKNTLLPLKFGDNKAGIAKARDLPVGDVMEFYFAPNFNVTDGWRKITLDLKHQILSNTAASKPSGVTYVR